MTETLEQIQLELEALNTRKSELEKRARTLKEQQRTEEESELSK